MARQNLIDRRSFIAASGAAVAASSIAPAFADEAPAAPVSPHSWENPPEPITDIAEKKEYDVVIVGGGIAGCAAAEAAARYGASVAVLEQAETPQFRGLENGHIGSTWQKEVRGLNIDPIDASRRLFAWTQQTANYNLIKTWATQSGRIFDYLAGLAAADGFTITTSRGPTAKLGWDKLTDRWRVYETSCCFIPIEGDDGTMFTAGNENIGGVMVRSAESNGAEFICNTRAMQLVGNAADGIKGVIAQDADGKYVEYDAAKGVILACGDIGGNEDMLKMWCPMALRADWCGYGTVNGNIGDGINMGLWAGAATSKSPVSPMVHHFDFGTIMLPVSSFYLSLLSVNRNGKRFCAEMSYEPTMTNARTNTPGNVAWSILDSDYRTIVQRQRPVDYEEKLAGIEDRIAGALENGTMTKADTLEELAEGIGIPVDAFLETVAHYNEICESGVDEEFGVPADFLAPIKTPPFYTCKSAACNLVVPFGLHVDDNSQVCTIDDDPIDGLFAIGNMQGDFFGITYPVICPGISIGRCWTFGQLVGEALAKDTVLTEILQ